MSEILEVEVKYGRTCNLGNFESERLDVELRATVGEDDDALTVTYDLIEQARQSVGFHLERLTALRRGDHFPPTLSETEP